MWRCCSAKQYNTSSNQPTILCHWWISLKLTMSIVSTQHISSSLYKMLPPGQSRGRVVVNTFHLFCRNCTGCLSDTVSTSNWQHSCLTRYTAAHRRISQTRASRRLRPVAVSARLAPSHASYRGPELVWATGRLMSPDRGFGTSCLLHCGCLTVYANSEDSWKRICLSKTRPLHLVTLAFRCRI